MTLHALTTEYQVLLEHHRRDPDDEHIWALYQQAHAKLEDAWVEHQIGRLADWIGEHDA